MILSYGKLAIFCSANMQRKFLHLLQFVQIIQYLLLLISFKVMYLLSYVVFSWHHISRSLVTVPFLTNGVRWVKLFWKLLFLSLPPARKTWSSLTKEYSEFKFLFCLTFATLSLILESNECISSANSLFCAILIIYISATLISTVLRSCSDFPIWWLSFASSFFGKSFCGKFF